jgi:hypothetical protein
MKDTSDEMYRKQFEIFSNLPIEERIAQGIEMINFGLTIVENSIKSKNPEITEKQLKIEKTKRLYSTDFDHEQLERIIEHFENL